MPSRLPEELVTGVLQDIRAADTFAREDALPNVLESEIYNYLRVQETAEQLGQEKVLVFDDKTQTKVSIKPYNLIVNLSTLWKQLPEDLADIITLATSDSLFTNLVAIMGLVRRKCGLFVITLDKKLEAVCVVAAQLSWDKEPVSADEIHHSCCVLRSRTADFPLIAGNELSDLLGALVDLRCLEINEEGKYKSCERVRA
jgi:hypothetical protein